MLVGRLYGKDCVMADFFIYAGAGTMIAGLLMALGLAVKLFLKTRDVPFENVRERRMLAKPYNKHLGVAAAVLMVGLLMLGLGIHIGMN